MFSERLKPEEFDAHLKNGTCRISFIGMSNGGKSYRARVLQDEMGFLWYQVDKEIQKALDFADMTDVSSWLGYPSSPQYAERVEIYLALENKFTKEASVQTNGKNLVFDTTGSVAQLKKDTLDTLSDNTLIVHLDVVEESLSKMIEKFFKEPKPVAWGNFFSMSPGESEEEALRRCYPALLKERLARYRALAHVNIPTQEVHDTSGEETLAIIRRHLDV